MTWKKLIEKIQSMPEDRQEMAAELFLDNPRILESEFYPIELAPGNLGDNKERMTDPFLFLDIPDV